MRRVLLTSVLSSALAALAGLGLSAPLGHADEGAAAPANDARAAELIRKLGSDDFRVREEASRDLAALGEAARPALEKAMRESESLEVRWRAEQLINRLERQGERQVGEDDAAQPGPVGEDDGAKPGARNPRLDDDPAFSDERRRLDELRRSVDEMRKRIESEWGVGVHAWPLPPSRGWGTSLFGRRVEAKGLRLEIGPDGTAVLHVKPEDGAAAEETYRGASLDEILAKNPKLAALPGMPDLERRLKEQAANPFGFGGIPGFGFSSSSGVEIRQEPGNVTVTIREKDPNGEEKVQTFTGRDLETIKKEHPEIAGKLRGFSISFGGPAVRTIPRVFRERRGLEPLPGGARGEDAPVPEPSTPGDEDSASTPRFGIHYEPVNEVLAFHLGLENGRGALVREVEAGSQAEAIGLRRHDVIVSVNGNEVKTGTPDEVERTVRALRAAAKDDAPLTLEVIRQAKRQTLSR